MRTLSNGLVASIACVFGVFFLLFLLGYRVNLTDSIPKGLYRITHSTRIKNNYVLFCPDKRNAFKTANARGYIDNGFCPSGFGYMMKKVVAVASDKISITDLGVIVNDKLLPYSVPLATDGANRALPHWRIQNYQLKQHELLTMTDQDNWSFDGRYYGLIKTNQIKGMLIPIWVKPIEDINP